MCLQAVSNGASTASISRMASSIFSSSLSSYQTLKHILNPRDQPVIPIPPAHTCLRPTARSYFSNLCQIGEISSAASHSLARFRREPAILSAQPLHNCPSSRRQILQTHSGSESERRHARTHAEGTHRIPVNSHPTEMRKRATSDEVAASETLEPRC